MERELRDASVIVAGASGGLGRPIAEALSRRGARLTLVARDPERLDAVGVDGPRVAGDLADGEVCDRAAAAALDAYGRLDGVVNAAGEVAFGPVEELDDDVLERLLASNLIGPLKLARAALPHLDGGFIVNLSAVVAEQPPAGMAVYSASKAALTSMSTSMRRELRRRKIDVLDARPPHTETGLAGRPVAGAAPALPEGCDPAVVAETIVAAVETGERELASTAFTD